MEIIINNLIKKYGKKTALNNISMDIGNGMFGLLGANGAGKTTLLRILATILKKSSGSVLVDGIRIENVNKLRGYIGYLPQEFSFYPNFTVYETMEYFCLLSKAEGDYKKQIIELLEIVNLSDVQKRKTKALSGGMKRRLGIASALINQPKLLLVDEPTAGLDPEERIKFRNLLNFFSENRTIILSTHIVGDIEETCNRLAILKEGNLEFYGTTEDLKKETKGMVWELECRKSELDMMIYPDSKKYIISKIPSDDMVKLRILSNGQPADEAHLVDSRIEDSYIKLMHRI